MSVGGCGVFFDNETNIIIPFFYKLAAGRRELVAPSLEVMTGGCEALGSLVFSSPFVVDTTTLLVSVMMGFDAARLLIVSPLDPSLRSLPSESLEPVKRLLRTRIFATSSSLLLSVRMV